MEKKETKTQQTFLVILFTSIQPVVSKFTSAIYMCSVRYNRQEDIKFSKIVLQSCKLYATSGANHNTPIPRARSSAPFSLQTHTSNAQHQLEVKGERVSRMTNRQSVDVGCIRNFCNWCLQNLRQQFSTTESQVIFLSSVVPPMSHDDMYTTH